MPMFISLKGSLPPVKAGAFINRFADHMNTTFNPARVNGIVDKQLRSIQKELELHFRRWGYHATTQERLNSLKEFAQQRPDIQRQQIMEVFNIQGTAAITLKTDTARGTIRINTVEINAATPGVDDPGNWTGVYFQGIPVRISAVPKPGYRFDGWVESGQREAGITLVLAEDLTLTASFTRQQ